MKPIMKNNWRVLGIVAIALFAITLIFIGTTSATYPTAVASSVQGHGLEADKAIDGDLTTRWSSNSFKLTNVIIEGRQILLNGKPFTIKGVGYAPTPICANPGDYFTYNYRSIYARDLPLLRATNCNAVRFWGWDSTSNHSDFLDEAYNNGADPIYVIAGYWIDPGRNLSDPNVREDIKNDFENMVATHKDHNAILMWCVGNELNGDWLNVNLSDWYSLLNECAQIAHDVEGENIHPVTTANWDVYDMSDYETVVKDLDAWGANVYRGSSLGDLFTEYANISTKPFWISEYGIDAFDNRYDEEYETIGPPYQAIYAGKLWDEMEASSVCSGGTIMAYCDEWWKAGDPCTHDNGGYPISAHPDGYSNEEWWGIMRTVDNGSGPDIMQPRKVYYALKNKWSTGVKYVLDDFDDGKPPNDFFADQGIWCEGSDSSINATFDNTTYYGENGRSLKLVYDAGSGDSLASYWEYFTFYYPDPWKPVYNMSEYDEFCLRVKGEGETIGSDTKFHIRFVDKNWNAAWVEIVEVETDWENKTIDLNALRTAYPSVEWTQMRELTIIFDNNRHGEGRYAHPLSGTLYFDDLVFVDYDVNITTDDQFLDLISKRTFKYFWDTAHPTTGLMRDRATNRELCSIASVGFGLTSYCVATERGWVNRSDAAERVEKVLNTLWNGTQGNESTNVTGYNGFFYHFLDMETGYRYEPRCELSSIDTALLLAGVLTCKEYFDGSDTTEKNITNLANDIYIRVNWTWMLDNDNGTLYMGWTPEEGFLRWYNVSLMRWEGYNEAMILYLLAIGSPNQKHSIPNSSWDAWAKTYKRGCGTIECGCGKIVDDFEDCNVSDWATFATFKTAWAFINISHSDIIKIGNCSMRIDYNTAGEWCGVYKDLNNNTLANYDYVSLWAYGDNSGNTLEVKLEEHDGEQWVYKQIINWANWKQLKISTSAFINIKNEPVNKSKVSRFTVAISGTNCSNSTIYLDDISYNKGKDFFIYCPTGSLFTYQYSHCWIDFRNKHDAYADYWQNSINAVKENRLFCVDNGDIYPTYGENCWGLTACDGPWGYRGYGSCPAYYHDGTIAPTGAGGSVALVPDLAIPALRFMYTEYGDKLWGVYGFRDAFNLDTDLSKPGNQEWWDKDYIGIDEGAIILMIENYRSGLVWNEFMQNEYIKKAMEEVGFVTLTFDTGPGTYPSIKGTHQGTITPLLKINVTRMYTYPGAGTGGHSEYVKFWNSTWNVGATWKGYVGNWHNITFDEPFVLEQGKIYNYTIITGSYPQIIHKQNHTTLDGSVITCEEFIDVNGRKYNGWIPAIRLE